MFLIQIKFEKQNGKNHDDSYPIISNFFEQIQKSRIRDERTRTQDFLGLRTQKRTGGPRTKMAGLLTVNRDKKNSVTVFTELLISFYTTSV